MGAGPVNPRGPRGGFQIRRSASAALATDQAARKPARTMSTTFQASLFLGPRRGNIGGMALRTSMTAIKMPVADATAACTGVAKGNMTVRMSDNVITSPRRHNPRRWETRRSTKFVSPKREAHFVSISSARKNRDISTHALRHSSSSTCGTMTLGSGSFKLSEFAARGLPGCKLSIP